MRGGLLGPEGRRGVYSMFVSYNAWPAMSDGG